MNIKSFIFTYHQVLYVSKKPEACNFIIKETLAEVFSCEFCEISKNIFFTEHLWTNASKEITYNI